MDFTETKVKGKKVITCGIISVNKKILIAKITNCTNTSESACRTVQLGIEQYGIPTMIMTDRGSPFVSKSFYNLLQSKGVEHSMSRAHTPIDNRFIETFWKSMKIEMGNVEKMELHDYLMLMDYYEYYYNNLRPHSSLGYLTPIESHLSSVI